MTGSEQRNHYCRLPSRMVVLQISSHDARPTSVIQHDRPVETLASNRTDDTLRERVLPRATRGGADLLDAALVRTTSRIACRVPSGDERQ